MGRTVPTFRMILEHVIGDWRSFRRALQLHDRRAFEAMMNHARVHAAAASNAARLNPTEALVMAILLEHQKELEQIKRKFEAKCDEAEEAKKNNENDKTEPENESDEVM